MKTLIQMRIVIACTCCLVFLGTSCTTPEPAGFGITVSVTKDPDQLGGHIIVEGTQFTYPGTVHISLSGALPPQTPGADRQWDDTVQPGRTFKSMSPHYKCFHLADPNAGFGDVLVTATDVKTSHFTVKTVKASGIWVCP